jgi:DNA-directed RNA polymerase subunit RPC12/RpoP
MRNHDKLEGKRHAGQTRCPACGSPETRRSRRKGFFEVPFLSIFHIFPYRCQDCDRRFYHRISPPQSTVGNRAKSVSPRLSH